MTVAAFLLVGSSCCHVGSSVSEATRWLGRDFPRNRRFPNTPLAVFFARPSERPALMLSLRLYEEMTSIVSRRFAGCRRRDFSAWLPLGACHHGSIRFQPIHPGHRVRLPGRDVGGAVDWGDNLVRSHGAPDTFTLEDYRARYASYIYKSDPDFAAAHAVYPWLVTWDDHEVSNGLALPLVPARGRLDDERAPLDCPSVSEAQVVERDRLQTCFRERLARVTADIAGATSHQN